MRATAKRLAEPAPLLTPIEFEITGAPITKKNSRRRLRFGSFVKDVPSAAYIEWRDNAALQVWAWRRDAGPISNEVSVRAVVYGQRNVGDLVNYLQAVGDMLEEIGLVDNDRLIKSWDGSRLRKDALRPRVEIQIAPYVG